MECDDDLPSGVCINQADGSFIGWPAKHSVKSDDDLPSGVAVGPGGYCMGQPANYSVESDDDLPSEVAVGPGGYFVGRPQKYKQYNLLRLARDKLEAVLKGDAAAATMPSELAKEAAMLSELGSELIKETNKVMTGSLKHVDRGGLLETACRETSDMVDELQANKGLSISGASNHGLGVPRTTIAEKMKNIRDMLEKIDWALYDKCVAQNPVLEYDYDGPVQYTSSNKQVGLNRILRRTGRIFVDLERLVDLLLLSSIASYTRQQGLPIILPIIGLGGIGKTTLAKLVYSHTKFRGYNKEWVHDPNDGLFRQQLPRGGDKVLVVLDDLHDKPDSRLLDVKRNLISDVGNNAIVIVTTRSEGAAKKICTVEPYKLQADMCFTMIKPTDELPAAGDTDSTLCRVLESLKESYKFIPPNLMSCFNYCAIFPEGQRIVKEDIIHQWIALDLIDHSDDFSHRLQHGEEYIRMLLDISFLQPATKLASTNENEYKGGTSFTMHDVVHALARSEANVIVLDGRNGKPFEKSYHKCALLINFDVTPMRLSNILSEHVTALLLLGCSKMELISSSFSFAKELRVLNIREPSMKKLPGSICELRELSYLNLSGCSGLTKLPESFGNLSMLYINLSGCSGLKNLPKSFGNLIKVVHVNLSGCHGLDDLPQSFCKLRNLEYLDLSFCSCLRELATALGELTNLRHLNLSHPCFYAVEHKVQLKQLKDVWVKLTKLQYLNMSMFMNPIFCYCYLPEEGNLNYLLPIKGLSSLEHLDLSCNIFLVDLPESLGDLNKLHTLHLSGCTRLERIAKKITEMKCLKNIVLKKCPSLSYSFVVRTADDGTHSSNIVQLEDVNCKELEISCLENVRSIKEANSIRLNQKQKLEKLTLGWTRGCHYESFVDVEALLAELVPPQNLQCFELKSYRGKCLPAWLTSSISSHLPNLVGVSMEDIPSCSTLPPFFLLPNLQQVTLRKMASRSIRLWQQSNVA